MKSIKYVALATRLGILGSSGFGGVLIPVVVVKSTRKSDRIASNSCAFSRGRFVVAALRRSCISFLRRSEGRPMEVRVETSMLARYTQDTVGQSTISVFGSLPVKCLKSQGNGADDGGGPDKATFEEVWERN